MKHSYLVIKTKAGWAVQNINTYVIVGVYSSQQQAEKVAKGLA